MRIGGTEIEDKIRYHVDHPEAGRFRLVVSDWNKLLDFDFPVIALELCRIPPLERAMVHEAQRTDGKAQGMLKVHEFVERIRAGWSDMPPVLLVGDWMFDGKHRAVAYRTLKRDSIPAIDLARFVSMEGCFHWKIKPPGESYFAAST